MKKTAEEWNAAYQVGTPVKYWPVLPKHGAAFPPIVSKTRSEAWTLGDGSPVVSIEGRSGGMHLSHIEAIAEDQ